MHDAVAIERSIFRENHDYIFLNFFPVAVNTHTPIFGV